MTLEAFYIGKHDVTNAQWKAYMDAEHRVVHKTEKGETLEQIAERYVQFAGKGMNSEWKAVYGLNWKALVTAWKGTEPPAWNPAWQVEDPPDLDKLVIPAGVELIVYRRRVPRSWYGWCKLSGLRLDGEYCDVRKPAAEAFQVPQEAPFTALKLRAKDFASYPIRDISPRDQLEFAEWCGCHLPSEYEYERAVAGDQVANQFTFGAWDHGAQKTLFPWADNPRVQNGEAPFPVDDPSCEKSVSPHGARMLHGNIWKLTRTFFDIHPNRKPAPPPPDPNLNNYALIAKGGSYGDGWHLLQRSVRADKIGTTGWLTLDSPNRADTLGVRLVRHPQPGRDLLMHSVMDLTYDTGRANYLEPTLIPLSFDFSRTAGVEHFHAKAADLPPYIHFERPAEAIAFVPLHFADIDDSFVREMLKDWKAGKAEQGTYVILGALRCDVPLAGGRKLTDTEAEALRKRRTDYDEFMKKWKLLSKKQRELMVVPEKPADYDPDEYETLTEKNSETCGLWRNGTIKAGAYYLVYWNGFLGLANKARIMPPDLIIHVGDEAKIKRNRRAANTGHAASTLRLDEAADAIQLTFEVEEQHSDARTQRKPPTVADSSLWDWYEVQTEQWTGGTKASGQVWAFDVTLPVPSGTLKAWNAAKGGSRRAVTKGRDGEPVEDGLKTPDTSDKDKKEDDPQ